MSHGPPIDYRYGWSIGRRQDQELLLYALLIVGVSRLFAAPSCHPWGSNSRGASDEARGEKREAERGSLRFLAMCCFIQILLYRQYAVENPAHSAIFDSMDSPLTLIRECEYHIQHLDQCMLGGELEGKPVRKSTYVQSNHSLGPPVRCDKQHTHLQLRGTGPMGSRTACSAVYPEPFVNLLLDQVPQTAPDGGRIDRGTTHFDSDSTHIRQVVHMRLGELKDRAVQRGMLSLWIKLVEPWMGTSTASSAHLNEERSVAKSGNLPTPVGNPVVLGPSRAPQNHQVDEDVFGLPQDPQLDTDIFGLSEFGPGPEESGATPVAQAPGPSGPGSSTPADPKSGPLDFRGIKMTGRLKDDPWQSKRYDKGSALWQAAAQRRHLHRRRTDASIGVCSVDLSGPHEPTPKPGFRVGAAMAHYFLVVTVRLAVTPSAAGVPAPA